MTEAQRLEKAGVDFIVIPCNTVHMFIEQVRESVKIPVLSIVEATTTHVKQNGFKTVGLVSTGATINNKVYDTVFKREGVKFIAPNNTQQQKLNQIILRIVIGEHLDTDRSLLNDVMQNLVEKGAECIILACTDLQILKPTNANAPVFDTMTILAESAIREIIP